MDFSTIFPTMSLLGVACPVILVVAVLVIRFINKNKTAADGERRQYPALRRALNGLLWASFVAVIAITGWQVWLIFRVDNVRVSPFFLIASMSVVIYTILLVGLVLYIRHRGAGQAQTGEERRRHPWLRRVLNFLMVLPLIVLVVVFIFRFLAV